MKKIFNDNDKFYFYQDLITFHGMQKYLRTMPPDIWIPLAKIRTSNHKFPIELYSWEITYKAREARICTVCSTGGVGDEAHYIFSCPVFKEDRDRLLPNFGNTPTLQTYLQLLKNDDINILRGRTKFLNILFSVFE